MALSPLPGTVTVASPAGTGGGSIIFSQDFRGFFPSLCSDAKHALFS